MKLSLGACHTQKGPGQARDSRTTVALVQYLQIESLAEEEGRIIAEVASEEIIILE